jgi:hypothetical protein
MRPSSAGADIRAPTSMGPESSGFLIRSSPSPPILVRPLTSLFVGTFSVLERSSSVSVPLRAAKFGSNFGSKGPQFVLLPATDGPAEQQPISAEGRIHIRPQNAPAAISGAAPASRGRA